MSEPGLNMSAVTGQAETTAISVPWLTKDVSEHLSQRISVRANNTRSDHLYLTHRSPNTDGHRGVVTLVPRVYRLPLHSAEEGSQLEHANHGSFDDACVYSLAVSAS